MNVGSCSQPWFEMQIQYDTQVRPCCYYAENLAAWDFSAPADLWSLWNGKPFMLARAVIAHDLNEGSPCSGCQFIRYATTPQYMEIDAAANDLQRANWEAALHNYHARELVVQSTPVRFYFNFGLACNLTCVMCCQMDERDKDGRTIPVERLKALKEHLVRANEIMVIGGEPFVLPQARSFIEALTTDPDYANIKLTICTNGALLGRFMPKLRSMRRLNISVSLDSVGETYEQIRQGANWEQTSRNVIDFKKEAAGHDGLWHIAVSGIVMKTSIPRLAEFTRWCIGNDIPVHFVPLVEYQFTDTENVFKHPELLKDLPGWERQFDEAIDLLEKKGWTDKGSAPLKLMKKQLADSRGAAYGLTKETTPSQQGQFSAEASRQPYLSIVAAARNDNHGGDMLKRMQMFVNGILEQSERFSLHTELIIVEWNPTTDKPPLREALTWPERNRFCAVRIIRVPPERHARYVHAGTLPLYQMIAKNVGIRRAAGEFVIATNIDILLSDELFAFMASRKLDPTRMYRCERHDVNEEMPLQFSQADCLEYCRNNLVRINDRYGSRNLLTGDYAACNMSDAPVLHGMANLHTNACGDFTMLSREAWFHLHGYPEFDMYSFHLDSLLCHMAQHAGYREKDLPPPLVTYHIEHGGGFKPKDQSLDSSLSARRIVRMTDMELILYVRHMQAHASPVIFNDTAWGLAEEEFQEVSPWSATHESPGLLNCAAKQDVLTPAPVTLVTAVRPFDGDDGIRQRNALRSWRQMMPDAEIVLLCTSGDLADGAAEFDARILQVEAGYAGYPRAADVVRVLETSATETALYLDSDVIMTSGLLHVVADAQEIADPLLIAGRTYQLAVWKELSFCHRELCDILSRDGMEKGWLSDSGDPGFLLVKQVQFGYVPPFSISSSHWKQWLLSASRNCSAMQVDATALAALPGQMHLQRTVPCDRHFNAHLLGGIQTTLRDADAVMTGHGLASPSAAVMPPEPDERSCYRFFSLSLEDAAIFGEVSGGIRLSEIIWEHISPRPELKYGIHLLRSRLFALASADVRAEQEIKDALAIDSDDPMVARLWQIYHFAAITGRMFHEDRYRLELADSDASSSVDQQVHALCHEAMACFRQQRFDPVISALSKALYAGSDRAGLRFGIALSLALSGRIAEALPYAEDESALPQPHSHASLLLRALKECMKIPAGNRRTAANREQTLFEEQM